MLLTTRVWRAVVDRLSPDRVLVIVVLTLLLNGFFLEFHLKAEQGISPTVTRELVTLCPGVNGTLHVGVVTTKWRDDPLNPTADLYIYAAVGGEVVCVDTIPGIYSDGGWEERPRSVTWEDE